MGSRAQHLRAALAFALALVAGCERATEPTKLPSTPGTVESPPSADDGPRVAPPSEDSLRSDGVCTADGWCADHPRAYVGVLKDVWGPGSGELFAVGEGGIFAHFDGDRWRFGHTGVHADLETIFGAEGAIYAGGDQGTLLRWRDGGWVEEPYPSSHGITALWTADGSDLVVVGLHGSAQRRIDGRWEPLAIEGETQLFTSVWGRGDELWVGDGAGLVRHFDGTAWQQPVPVGAKWVYGLHGTADDLFASTVWMGGLAQLVDGRWRPQSPLDGHHDYRDVWASGGGRAFAITEDGAALTHADGRWQTIGRDLGRLLALWGRSPEDVTAVGKRIVRFDGTRWSTEVDATSPPPIHAGFSIGGATYAVGNEGTILRRGVNGWTLDHQLPARLVETIPGNPETKQRLDYLQGIWGSSADRIFVVGNDHNLLTFDGRAWREVERSRGRWPSLNAVWGHGPNLAYAVGSKRVLRWDGEGWEQESVPGATYFRDVWGTGPNDVWIVGGSTVIHRDATGWSEVEAPFAALPDAMKRPQVQSVWARGAHVFVAFRNGVASFDGKAWSYTPAATMEGPGVRPREHEDIYRIRGTAPDDVWAVGQHGFVAHYDGRQWTRERSGTQTLLQGLWIADDAIYASGTAGILRRAR